MNQPIEQTLKIIKTVQKQYKNGYHISDYDYSEFNSAVNEINYLYHDIAKYVNKVKEIK
jgi:hypothetical protein